VKVAAVVVVYRGLLESVQVFSDTGKARKRYDELVKKYDLSEDGTRGSIYSVSLESELLVY